MTVHTAVSQRPGRPRSRWRRRWYRVVVPFAVLGLLVGVTMLARHLEEPNLRDAGTLSPTGTGPDGSSRLAQLLTDRGVRIDYVDDIEQAFEAGETGEDSVVFIPKPTLFAAYFAGFARFLPGEHRVVMVAPGGRHLLVAGAPVGTGRSRWAATDAPPGCNVPEATAAGRAGVLRNRYQLTDPDLGRHPDHYCYRGGMVRATMGYGAAATELYVVGAADPFRNRRIGEHGNAELAVGLLAAYDRVIWVGALPFDVDFQFPRLRPELPELEAPRRSEPDRTAGGAFDNIFFGYPRPIVVALGLLAVLALLVAVARSRRLGPPVSEPLPVLVPAAEAVAGRGRLYQRARGRGVALAALRAAALRRLAPVLGLSAVPPPAPDQVVAALVARTGLPADYLRQTLYGPEPETDEQLTQAVAALDALVAAVTREGGHP